MFNTPIDGYSAVKNQAATQNIAGGQNTISGSQSARSVENAKTEVKQSAEVDKTTLANAVNKLNELVSPALQSVQFKMDEESDRVIVQVVDTATHKVLRQIPNEEVLAFSKTLGRLQGLVVREQA